MAQIENINISIYPRETMKIYYIIFLIQLGLLLGLIKTIKFLNSKVELLGNSAFSVARKI